MIPAMADKEKQNIEDVEPKEKKDHKAYWLGFLITFIISIPFAVGSFFLIKAGLSNNPWEQMRWRVFADTFTLPGVLFSMSFLLVKVSNYGAFDAIVYSVRLVFNLIFHSDIRKTKLPANYRDYRLMKASKPRKPVSYILLVGLLYLLVATVFIILYFTIK